MEWNNSDGTVTAEQLERIGEKQTSQTSIILQ